MSDESLPDNEIEGDWLDNYEPGITFTTACEKHTWALTDGDPKSDMDSYVCIECGSGMNKARGTT